MVADPVAFVAGAHGQGSALAGDDFSAHDEEARFDGVLGEGV